MTETRDEELGLEITSGQRTSDGRARLSIDAATPLRIGSDPARANAVVVGLAPLHATVAPVKGGGIGLRIEGGASATLNGEPVVASRLAANDTINLGAVTLRVVAAAPPVRTPLPSVPGYRLEKQLGRGAMGRVYLAVQESLDRKVALKLLEPQLCRDATFVAEFQSEARAAAALHHNNVVTVFDVGEHGGRHYLALEYMDRGSLEDRLVREGPLPWRAVLAIVRDAAAGLEYAESKGIVHRDIKPANLMQNATGVTKIVDLGLAVAAEHTEEGGKIRGTAHFIAPEQARGEPLDSRADIYALGASAWRLLTARTPFTGATPREILRAALTEPPPPLAEHVPGLPREVEQLVLDLMAKDPAQRPASARVLRERVEALIQRFSNPALATDGESAAGGGRRLKLVLGAATLVLAGVAIYAFGPGRTEPAVDPLAGRQTDGPRTPDGRDPDGAANESGDENRNGANDEATQPVVVRPPVAAGDGDEDAALRIVEERAQRLLTDVDVIDDPALVRERLQRIVADFPGTTAATLAAERLASETPSETDTASTPVEVVDLAALRTTELAARTAAARAADGSWLPPQRALSALLDAVTPAPLRTDEGFLEQLAALHLGAEAQLRNRAERDFRSAYDHVDAGRFEEARLVYVALLAWLEDAPPAPPPPTSAQEPAPPPPPLRLADVIERAQQERDELPSLAERFEAAMAHRDLLARHAALSAAGPFTNHLGRFDFAAAARLIASLETRSNDGESWAREKSQWLNEAARFDALLRSTFNSNEWRRRSVAVPGPKREVREVVAIDDRGLVFESGGTTSVVSLTDFGGSTDLVATLVYERLSRPWRDEEHRTIAAALVATTIHEGLVLARPALENGTVAKASADALAQAVARARAWANDLDTDLTLELNAADVLHALLEALASNDLGRAAWASDALVELHARTLLVTCLSNGRSAPVPASWPPQR